MVAAPETLISFQVRRDHFLLSRRLWLGGRSHGELLVQQPYLVALPIRVAVYASCSIIEHSLLRERGKVRGLLARLVGTQDGL